MRTDPRIRQNLDRLSNSLESAADDAYTSCFTFTKSYIEPCIASITNCCFACLPRPSQKHLHHRHRGSHRGRPTEFPFAFYDYYDEYDDDEYDDHRSGGGFLAWSNGELDRLLAGSGSSGGPHREVMYYGASASTAPDVGIRRKSTLPGRDAVDPTVIPTTSMFGFLSKFGIRGRNMRYKPSAANLQEHPQRGTNAGGSRPNGRKRSETTSSGESGGDSLRSRLDLWPSEDEDDAVVIGDDAFPSDGDSSIRPAEVTGDDDLREEELRVEREEEEEVIKKREKAHRLAVERGLTVDNLPPSKPRSIPPKDGNCSSAPPTVLATSPEPYMAERLATSPLVTLQTREQSPTPRSRPPRPTSLPPPQNGRARAIPEVLSAGQSPKTPESNVVPGKDIPNNAS